MSSVSCRLIFFAPIVLLGAAAHDASAQGVQRDPARRAAIEATIAKGRAALAPIAAIVGEWEGDARILAGDGAPMTVRQSESIAWGAGETVVMIRGTGRSVEAANRGEIVFEAAAIVWNDAASDSLRSDSLRSNSLRMRTFRDGRSLAVDVEVRGDTLVWGFPSSGGRVRYTIVARGDTYHEIGEFLRPGGAPIKTIEMTLRRK